MHRIRILLVLFSICVNVFATRYALLIGSNRGPDGFDKLRYAVSDADRFNSILVSYGNFNYQNVITLRDPKSKDIQSAFKTIHSKIKQDKSFQDDLFLIYYSGHADNENLLLGDEKYPLISLYKGLEESKSGIRIGIFDACHSGAVTSFKGGKRAEPFHFLENASAKGQVIIASSAASERSQESPTLKGSIFSFHWFNALRGSADISNDKKISLNEAYNYAYRKTIETTALATGEIQHPSYRFNITGQGDIILTDLRSKRSGLQIDKAAEGSFLVLSDSYLDVFADFTKKAGQETFIVLDPGKYVVIGAQGSFVGSHKFTLNQNSRYVLKSSMLQENFIERSSAKGMVSQPVDRPPIKFFAAAGGAFFKMPSEVNLKQNVLGVELEGVYKVNNGISFFVNGTFLPQAKMGALSLGPIFTAPQGAFEIQSSIGLGGAYFDKFHDKNSVFKPILNTQIGISCALTSNLNALLSLPLIATLEKESSFIPGIKVQINYKIF